MVEADGGLHEVRELLADVDASVEPVALRPHDPDVPHARIMGEPATRALVTSGYVSARARASTDRMNAVLPST